MINIGLIGHGRVAERHARAISAIEQTQLWSVAGRDLARATSFAEQFNAQVPHPSWTDVAAMLDDHKLDAVIITTPDKQHASNIISVLSAQKSILVEKPLCTELSECEQILSALQDDQQTMAVAYHLRWHDGLRKIALRCHQQEWGRPNHLKLSWGVQFFGQHKWRTDQTQSRWLCLTVLGTHLIDIARWLMVSSCGEIIHTDSKVTCAPESDFDRAVSATFTFESGATCELDCSVIKDAAFHLELSCEHAKIVGHDLAGDGRAILVNQI